MKINTKDGSWGSKRASRNQTEKSKSFNTTDEIQHLAGKGEERVFINRTNSSPRLYKCESTYDDKKDMCETYSSLGESNSTLDVSFEFPNNSLNVEKEQLKDTTSNLNKRVKAESKIVSPEIHRCGEFKINLRNI